MATRTLSTTRTALTDYLGDLAERLRTDALALDGYAALHAPMGSGEGDSDLEALAYSLRHTATQIAAIGDGLCRACRMLHVTEHLTVEIPKKHEPVQVGKESRRRSRRTATPTA